MLLPDFSRLSLGPPRRRAAPTDADGDGAALLVEADERKKAANDLADLADDRQEAAKDLVDLPKYHAALAVAGLSTRERDASPEEPRPKKRHERWAEWEKAELRALVSEYGTNWVKITEVWNARHPDKQRNHGQLSRRGQRMRQDEQAGPSRPPVEVEDDEDGWTVAEEQRLRRLVKGFEKDPRFASEGIPWALIVVMYNDRVKDKRKADAIMEKGKEFLKQARYYGDYGRTSDHDREQQREARGRRAQGR